MELANNATEAVPCQRAATSDSCLSVCLSVCHFRCADLLAYSNPTKLIVFGFPFCNERHTAGELTLL